MPSDSVSMDTAAQFAEICSKFGVDGTAALVAHGHVVPDASSGTLSPTTEVPAVSSANHLGLSSEQADRTFRYLLDQGLSEDVVRAAMESSGFTEVGDDSPEIPFDDSAAYAAGRPSDYSLDSAFVGREGSLDELNAIGNQIRSALAAMEWPVMTGNSFATDLLDAARDGYNSQPEASRTQWSNDQISMAIKATGATSREDLLRTCRVATDLLSPAIRKEWMEANVADDRRVLSALFLRGEAILQQRGLKRAR